MSAADVLGFPPYALGWLAGLLVRFFRWLWDCIAVGYLDGIGERRWQERAQRRE